MLYTENDFKTTAVYKEYSVCLIFMKCNRGRYFCMEQSIHVGVSRVTALLLMAY